MNKSPGFNRCACCQGLKEILPDALCPDCLKGHVATPYRPLEPIVHEGFKDWKGEAVKVTESTFSQATKEAMGL